MCCCYPYLHRHQIHLISYGCVSFTLLATGLVFTIFSVFQKDSQIGKVWLAGPTTMVVGLVLCGKVIIDWGPAMKHGRGRGDTDSIDSRLIDQLTLSNPLVSVAGLPNGETTYLKPPLNYGGMGSSGDAELRKFSDRSSLTPFDYLDPSLTLGSFPQPGPTTLIEAPEGHHSFASSVPQLNALRRSSIDRVVPMETRDRDSSGSCDDLMDKRGAVDFITCEAQSNSNISSLNSAQTQWPTQNILMKPPPATVGTQTVMSFLLPRAFYARLAVEDDCGLPALSSNAQLDHPQCSCHLAGVVVERPQLRNYGSAHAFDNTRGAVEERRCASYGSLQMCEERRAARMELYQGETFVMNDKAFLI